ncbi:MAG TPA: low temperature-induced protein [Crinalium sp.]|jgi:muramidase (phage lysozyme)
MKSIRLKGFNFNFVRSLLVAIACAVLFFSNMAPAAAISSSPSSPRSGETPLNEIFEKSEDALRAEPRTMKELQTEASKGYNEVQGNADFNDAEMKRPENSQDATTAAEQVEDALKKITHQD